MESVYIVDFCNMMIIFLESSQKLMLGNTTNLLRATLSSILLPKRVAVDSATSCTAEFSRTFNGPSRGLRTACTLRKSMALCHTLHCEMADVRQQVAFPVPSKSCNNRISCGKLALLATPWRNDRPTNVNYYCARASSPCST